MDCGTDILHLYDNYSDIYGLVKHWIWDQIPILHNVIEATTIGLRIDNDISVDFEQFI